MGSEGRQAVGEDRERAVPQEVHLHQPDGLDSVLVKDGGDDPLGGAPTGDEVCDRTRGDDDAARVQPEVSWRADEGRCSGEHSPPARVVEGEVARLGCGLEGAGDGVFCVARSVRFGVEGCVWEPPRPAVHDGWGDPLCEGCFAEGGAQPEAVERRDHRGALAAKELVDVLDDLITATPAEVEVDVWAIASLWVEEALEDQPVAEGVCLCEAEAVRDEAVGGGAAADAGDLDVASPARDALAQEEVGREAEAVDRGELVIEATDDLRAERLVALARAVEGVTAEL